MKTMEKRNPILRENPSVIQKVLKFVLFLVTTVLVFPLTFHLGKNRGVNNNYSKPFFEFIDQLLNGDLSYLLSFSLDSLLIWGKITLSLIFGGIMVYFGGYQKLIQTLKNKNIAVSIILVIFLILFYTIILIYMIPDILNYLFG